MFVGRRAELARLEELYARNEFELVIVYGRRRIGKTTLIREFAKGKRTLFYTALEQADSANLRDFSAQIAEFFGLPAGAVSFDSWQAAFAFLGQKAAEERFLLVLDEFPYAAVRNESLPSVLQIAIDQQLQQTNLFMILCGSNQGFMESEVLGRKSPLFGRRTAQMKIGQLSYLEAWEMMPSLAPQDAFRFYGCFGGVPYYLGLLRPEDGLRSNLESLYFSPSGFLFDEPMSLLRQETREPAIYASVLRAVAGGANRPNEMSDRVGLPQTTVSRYLRILVDMGIVEKIVPFGENRDTSKRGIYRLSDACYEFWFQFVMPQVSDIEAGLGSAIVRALPDKRLNDFLGHRFEFLCQEWLTARAREGLLPIPATSVGSWWGTNPSKRAQDDIDVLAADKTGKKLLIGECKYRESFNLKGEVFDLLGKCDLVKGYKAEEFYIFSKYRVDEVAASELSETGVRFMCLDDMYKQSGWKERR